GLILKSRLGPQVRVFANQCAAQRNRIVFRLRGTKSNRDAIGARGEVDGQAKWVSAGSGYLSQHTKKVHFGLATGRKPSRSPGHPASSRRLGRWTLASNMTLKKVARNGGKRC
ncbi:MAG: hypothetical protein DMG58_06545, partial [Acidobacteria bacterium]